MSLSEEQNSPIRWRCLDELINFLTEQEGSGIYVKRSNPAIWWHSEQRYLLSVVYQWCQQYAHMCIFIGKTQSLQAEHVPSVWSSNDLAKKRRAVKYVIRKYRLVSDARLAWHFALTLNILTKMFILMTHRYTTTGDSLLLSASRHSLNNAWSRKHVVCVVTKASTDTDASKRRDNKPEATRHVQQSTLTFLQVRWSVDNY